MGASSNVVWQQVLALDARYNAYRSPNNAQFRTQYIRRRSQLLRENAKHIDSTIRKRFYLQLRSQLLAQRYGPVSEASSLRSVNVHGNSSQLEPVDCNDEKVSSQFPPRLIPTKQAEASRAMVGGKSVGENYAFAGMHHVFDDVIGHPATTIKFANDERHLLAYSSMAGVIAICKTQPTPGVIRLLEGHTGGVTDFSWSLSNDLLLSSSLDGSLKLWQTSTGTNIRDINSSMLGLPTCAIQCCLFQPVNNNMVVFGSSSGHVVVVNISTGKSRKGAQGKLNGEALCLCFDSSGRILWAGDDQGTVYSFSFDLASGVLRKGHQLVVQSGFPITSIQSRSWISREARDPSVLVNVAADVMILYRVTDARGLLHFKKSFPINHRNHRLRSLFCPLMSFRQGACVVTGSEDMSVRFFDIERSGKGAVNRLLGHSAAVIDVAFNCDESLLASCDVDGVVIIWKREQQLISVNES